MPEHETFTPWESADYLQTDEDVAAYFDACLEEDPGDGSLIRLGLINIARAKGLSGATEEPISTISMSGNTSFASVLKVMHTLGLRLHTEVLHP